ncbi:hypothetical protein N7462_011302 [Penicillium macrosclerotiorum]|uniref:uncharacterized protein n=1 Tax=Penicillium macrosclerotiorum TaxID=303699 RepID=UPI0025482C01|nr:uncharacterized protein N7462_011302 [Penicillium macrosclerotiorum]KAJ5666893.1 hypothetical protein N7462_011302 [Penicillium macrosclerotiorum]
MGQSASTARDLTDTGYQDYHPPFPLERDPTTRNEDMNERHTSEHNEEANVSPGVDANSNINNDTALSQLSELPETWQHPTRSPSGFSRQMRSIEEEEDSEIDPASPGYRSAAISRMAARRQSTMSRLGSRILPNSVIRGLLSSQEETPAEGHAHRHGLVSRTPPRSETGHSSGRFSPFSALGSRGVTRRRNTRAPYFIPQRADRDSSAISDSGVSSSLLDTSADRMPDANRFSWRRARLQRMRHSLSTPISHMFGQPPSEMSSPHVDPSHIEPGPPFHDPSPSAMDTRLDFGEPLHELDSVESGVQPDGPLSGNQPNPGLMGMRRLPGLIRARSARTLRRDEQTPLSRVLQLAAAAIAAQLSGAAGPALPNIQALGNEGLDGSLENFIQSLQHATSTQPPPPTSGEGPSNAGSDGPTAPVNFLRVFRFANSDSPLGPGPLGRTATGPEAQGSQTDGMSIDETSEGSEGRMVTLVVVGVRSVPSGNGGNNEQAPPVPGGPGLDALLGLPFLPQNAIPRPQETGSDFVQRPDARSRLHAPRLPGHLGLQASGAPELLRQPAARPSRRIPPGPHPPPSTPAEPGLSAVSSGTSTPSRRPSSASAMSPNVLPQLNEGQSLQSTLETSEDSAPPNAARQRRRSDSEFARHRALGSGSVRRNGVVEPDQPPPSGGRSWLIYVVGTNLSENHPALTTPSLFTDNPTYEDMILLSSLLGPAKPPVASQDDVNSAGGLFRLVEYSGSLVAEAVDGTGAIQISDGERCLICLSDYEVAEEVRELAKCKHVFHKDCIDQWLTTGRNSCPLCRGQGVKETSNNDGSAPEPAPVPEGMAI